jgi:acyl-CoA-dependent ceramide synthase
VLDVWQKDFGIMMFHHFLTSFLVGSSYYFNFTKVGHVVLVEQDFADIFLPFAKIFKYGGYTLIQDIFFHLFAISWIPTRHGIYFWIYHSILYHSVPVAQEQGTMIWDPDRGLYWGPNTIPFYLVVMAIFQCLLLVWLKDLLVAIYQSCKEEKYEDPHEKVE